MRWMENGAGYGHRTDGERGFENDKMCEYAKDDVNDMELSSEKIRKTRQEDI